MFLDSFYIPPTSNFNELWRNKRRTDATEEKWGKTGKLKRIKTGKQREMVKKAVRTDPNRKKEAKWSFWGN